MKCTIPVDLINLEPYFLPGTACAIAVIYLGIAAIHRKRPLPKSASIVLSLSFLVIIATFGSIIYQSKNAEITFDGVNLTGRTLFVSASVPFDAIILNKVIDASSYKYSFRKYGTSFSGVQIGWFQTSEGRSVFSLRSNKPSVLVPTKGDFDFVLSKDAFDQLLDCKQP